MATYFIIGELATKTDMKPVTEWAPPVDEAASATIEPDAGLTA